jgi:hypothetical protein
MFIVDENPEFTRKVKVLVPVNGGHEQQDFTATFRVVPVDESAQFDLTTSSGVLDMIKHVLVRCDGLGNRSKEPVEWNDQVRDQLLAKPYTRSPILAAYFAAINGEREGN